MDRRALIIIFLVVFTDVIGLGVIIPVLPEVIKHWSSNQWQISLLLTAYSIAQFPAAPLLGYLSDIFGRKPILVISKFGSVLAYVIFAFSPNFYWLLFSRLLDGFTGGNISTARAYIADITTPHNRSRGMAVIGVAFGLGFIFGPLLGSVAFAFPNGQMSAGLFGGLACLLSTLFTIIALPESLAQPQPFSWPRLRSSFRLLPKFPPHLAQILYINFFVMLAMSAFQGTFTFFTSATFGYTPQDNGRVLAFLGLASLLVQGNLVRIKFKDIHRSLKWGLIIASLGIILISATKTLPFLLLFLVVYVLGNAVVGVLIPTLASTLSRNDPEGETQGILESIGALARIIGPAIAGLFITLHPSQTVFTLGLINLLALLFLTRSNQSSR